MSNLNNIIDPRLMSSPFGIGKQRFPHLATAQVKASGPKDALGVSATTYADVPNLVNLACLVEETKAEEVLGSDGSRVISQHSALFSKMHPTLTAKHTLIVSGQRYEILSVSDEGFGTYSVARLRKFT